MVSCQKCRVIRHCEPHNGEAIQRLYLRKKVIELPCKALMMVPLPSDCNRMQKLDGKFNCMSLYPMKLHDDILDILYENRRSITKIFREVIGFYDIDHVSLTLRSPSNEFVVFSITPNIEYNLITQGLWQHDCTNFPSSYINNDLIWWDEDKKNPYFSDIYKIKGQKNNYTLGMSLSRKIEGFFIIYSFATKNKNINLRSYYISNIQGLYDIGDHCYKLIRDIYSSYCKPYVAPVITNALFMTPVVKKKPYLQLIVNNNFL